MTDKPTEDGATAPTSNANDATEKPTKKRRRRRRLGRQAAAKRNGQIDLRAMLEEPITVLKDGKAIKMSPIEAAMRRQVQKALNEKNLPAIKEVINLALKYGLVAPPDKGLGGIIIIPKTLSEELYRYIFTYPGPPVAHILALLEDHYAELEQK